MSFGGQSSAAQGSAGFSFGSTPAVGAALGSSSFSFGGQSQPASAFGFGPSSGPSASAFSNPFGQPASSPSFGASSAATGLFGASSSSFSFGSAGLFGAQSQAASAPSLFGSAPAFGSFGGFSGLQTQSAPSTVPVTAAQPGATFPGGLPGQPDYSALKELEAIAAAYNPASGRFRFNALFLNVVDVPAARVKPADVDELQWRAALQQAGGADNPDRLWPVQAKGFADLIARKNAQDEALREHASRLEAAEHFSKQLARKHDTVITERIETVRRRHLELSHRLLQTMRHVDALEGRFADSQQLWDVQSPEVMRNLSSTLRQLETSVSPASAGGLQHQADALATAARLRKGAPLVRSDDGQLSEASLASVFDVLQQQADAIGRLQAVLERIRRSAALLRVTDHGEQ